MATTTRVHVDGLRELGQAMKALGDEVGSRIARGSTGAGARVIQKRTKANIRSNESKSGDSIDKGDLLDSVITKRVRRGESQLTSEHIVTYRGKGKPTTKSGKKIGRAPHAHLVEFGTVNMPAEPNMRRAFEEGKDEALTAMTTSLRRGIERAVRRNSRGVK